MRMRSPPWAEVAGVSSYCVSFPLPGPVKYPAAERTCFGECGLDLTASLGLPGFHLDFL